MVLSVLQGIVIGWLLNQQVIGRGRAGTKCFQGPSGLHSFLLLNNIPLAGHTGHILDNFPLGRAWSSHGSYQLTLMNKSTFLDFLNLTNVITTQSIKWTHANVILVNEVTNLKIPNVDIPLSSKWNLIFPPIECGLYLVIPFPENRTWKRENANFALERP